MTNPQNKMTPRLECLTWEELKISDEQKGTFYQHYWQNWTQQTENTYPGWCLECQESIQERWEEGKTIEELQEIYKNQLQNGWTLTLVPESPAALPG